MAATKYQVLYRYTNQNSNQLLTNDVETEYKQVFEFYHNEHKIECGTEDEKLEAENEKSNLIIEGNNTANDNYNMLFKFTGTKRVNKKVWEPESTGYVIRDTKPIKDLITRAVDGDYSGDYLLIEGDTIENGVVIARKNISSDITVITDESLAANNDYYTSDEIRSILQASTMYELDLSDLSSYKNGNTSKDLMRKTNSDGTITTYGTVYTGPVFIDEQPQARNGNNESVDRCVSNKDNSCKEIIIKPSHVKEYTIPAHYEEYAESPYVICDTYKRVEQSPWFILSIHGSLTAALEKAKTVVKAVGLDNVKLIKVVPTEQFVKIK